MLVKGHCHLVTLAQDLSDWINFFFLETTEPTEVIFHVEPALNWSMKIKKKKNGVGHMANMAAIPKYVW